MPAKPVQEVRTRDAVRIARAVVRARYPQSPATTVLEDEDVAQIAGEVDGRSQTTRAGADHQAIQPHDLGTLLQRFPRILSATAWRQLPSRSAADTAG